MADPVSLTLGITPLVISALSAYSAIYGKFQTYRQYSRAILRLNRQFETQRRLFLNECHFLLRLVVSDERTIRAMLANPEHTKWTDSSINGRWKKCLDANYDTCLKIVEEIDEGLTELRKELNQFDSIQAQRQDDNTQARMRRIQSAIKLSFKKSGYDQLIEALRAANADLQILRKHIKEFRKPTQTRENTQTSLERKRPREECPQYESIRQVSRALHESLTTAWSCSESTHLAHYAKLLLDASATPEVRLNLIILSESRLPQTRPTHNSLRIPRPGDWVRLSVRSYSQTCHNSECPVASPAGANESDSPEEAIEPPGKRLLLADHVAARAAEEAKPPWSEIDSVNLRSSPDICSDLARQTQTCQLKRNETCLGYIDTTGEGYRHVFYSGDNQKLAHQPEFRGRMAPVYELLGQPLDHTLTVVDQLKLVRTLVSATLQLHATPWLNEYWGLQDIGFFRRGDGFSDSSLQSLHVTTGFPPKGNDQVLIDETEEYFKHDFSKMIEDARVEYGIRNLPLYCLGVVLLQIGHWALVDGGDVGRIRRLAVQSCRLGPRYKNIAQKCLDCDFGLGSDLCTPQLQQAVQSNVLDELGEMINSLDINKLSDQV